MLVDDIERLRTVLGVERISLLGHSFGGLLALEYAARYPEQVEGLVVVSGLSDVPATGKSICVFGDDGGRRLRSWVDAAVKLHFV